ncbi:hypothetical protein TWF281_002721 [Arthrobotrys megalospora]
MANIKSLPAELHVQILSFITSFYDRSNVSRVCKLWSSIITETSLKSKFKYNYGVVPTSRYPIPVHKLLQLYTEDHVGTSGPWGTSLRGIFFGCTIEGGRTKQYFIHDSSNAEEGLKNQNKTSKLDISSFGVLNELVCQHLSDDACGESVWEPSQGYKSIIDEYDEYNSDEHLNPEPNVIKLWLDISCTFGNKPDEFYSQKIKAKINRKLQVYETTSVRELVERTRRRVKDGLRRANLQISEPYELRFEVRSYNYGGQDDCFLKLSVNIYHEDEDYIKGNPFKVMRATKDRFSKQFSKEDEDYIRGNPFNVMRATRDRLSKQFNLSDYTF